MKKILAFLLAMTMVLCLLAGCGNENNTGVLPGGTSNNSTNNNGTGNSNPDGTGNSDPDPVIPELTADILVGKWEVNLKAPEDLLGGEEAPAFMQGMELDVTMKAIYEFKEDGTVVATVSEESVGEMVDKLLKSIENHLKAGAIYDIYAEQGMDKATLDAFLEQSGISINDLIDQIMVMIEPMKGELVGALGDTTEEFTYTLKDDVLTLTSDEAEEIKCSYDGDKTVTMTSGGEHNGVTMVKKDAE